ncbi:FBP domain-containing protein [Glaciihabitans sp. dw_435]|uniref:FBP domain-containing protein n=1 Tax=Glaciihabitans sp. dw_435 TaxID=2720081 RepID=UPI001BD4F9F5|nr:FBP domain-containing protein [Glaciihabitans sp. dw_435]
MRPLTDTLILGSFVNASQRERQNLTLPADLGELAWDKIDYLGWHDRKTPNLGLVVAEVDGAPVGILLRQTDSKIRSRPQCTWCEDIYIPNDVTFYSVKRSGQAGRNGNTVGTLVCANFECSSNVRKLPPVAYLGFDVEAARLQRIASLQERVANFVRDIRDGV